MSDKITAWTIRFVQTEGIVRHDDWVQVPGVNGYLARLGYCGSYIDHGKIGEKVFLSEAEAIEAAKKKLAKAIKSQERRIQRLQERLAELDGSPIGVAGIASGARQREVDRVLDERALARLSTQSKQ